MNPIRRAAQAALAATLALTLVPAAALAAIAPASTEVEINATNFPDATFRQYISENFDTNSNGTLSAEEVEAVATINVNSLGITSLTGIEHFTSLTKLLCSFNTSLTTVTLTSSSLTYVALIDCALTSLNVQGVPNLQTLGCAGNKLTSLNVSSNTALTSLNCSSNQITSLDVSSNAALQTLNCNSNQITSLDISANAALTALNCADNLIQEIDVRDHQNLNSLYVDNNQLVELTIPTRNSVNESPLNVLSASGNTRSITIDSKSQFDLSTLGENFDIQYASGFSGGSVNGTILTVDEGKTKVTYDYYVGVYLTNRTSITITLSIANAITTATKKSQSIKLSTTSAKVKYKKLKKKAQKVTIKVSGVKTSLKGSSVSPSASVKVKGKTKLVVTLKKGAKKGSYKIKVWAASNKKYKTSSFKTVTIKVK